jgi:hypothetical protein
MNATPIAGLKARHMTAQGNALGVASRLVSSPERAAQNSRRHFVLPFQGVSGSGRFTQGVALGCHVIAPSARRNCGVEKIYLPPSSNFFTAHREKFSTQSHFLFSNRQS